MRRILSVVLVLVFMVSSVGCAVKVYGRRQSDVDEIGKLSNEVASLEALREQDLAKMEEIRLQLERKLKGEIGRNEITLDLAERGLVITFIDKVLFDSGKAEIKKDGISILV